MALGSVLRRRREALGRTLTELALEAGVSPAHLSEVERGRKDVSTDLLLAVTHALGVPAARVYAELARELGAQEPIEFSLDADPRVEIQRAARVLDPDALRTVAHFSAYLAQAQQVSLPPRRPIGFTRG